MTIRINGTNDSCDVCKHKTCVCEVHLLESGWKIKRRKDWWYTFSPSGHFDGNLPPEFTIDKVIEYANAKANRSLKSIGGLEAYLDMKKSADIYAKSAKDIDGIIMDARDHGTEMGGLKAENESLKARISELETELDSVNWACEDQEAATLAVIRENEHIREQLAEARNIAYMITSAPECVWFRPNQLPWPPRDCEISRQPGKRYAPKEDSDG